MLMCLLLYVESTTKVVLFQNDHIHSPLVFVPGSCVDDVMKKDDELTDVPCGKHPISSISEQQSLNS